LPAIKADSSKGHDRELNIKIDLPLFRCCDRLLSGVRYHICSLKAELIVNNALNGSFHVTASFATWQA
jgi:hypothetical protein